MIRSVLFLFLFLIIACGEKEKQIPKEPKPVEKSISQIKAELEEKGFSTFDYIDEKTGDTVIMQQYYMVFLKKGPNKSDSKEMADSLQVLHLQHLGRMYEEGYADISGPMGYDGEIRGITIYNTPTKEIADSLARLDPLVQKGMLTIEIHPWWAGKGFPLR